MIQNNVYRFQTYAQLAEYHSLLPCSGHITSIVVKGRFATAVFRLGDRKGSPCDSKAIRRRCAVRDRRREDRLVAADPGAGEARSRSPERLIRRAQDSSASRSSIVSRRRITVASPSRDEHGGGPRHRVVVRAHRERVAAGRGHGEDVAAARLGQLDALDQQVARLAVLAGDRVGAGRGSSARFASSAV